MANSRVPTKTPLLSESRYREIPSRLLERIRSWNKATANTAGRSIQGNEIGCAGNKAIGLRADGAKPLDETRTFESAGDLWKSRFLPRDHDPLSTLAQLADGLEGIAEPTLAKQHEHAVRRNPVSRR